ncbi:MAG: hypothetical protein RL338_376 [Chloroflexota bacterium]|jgi:hypothetical protein
MAGNGNGGATVGPKEQVAVGVIAMGIFTIFLPNAIVNIVEPDNAYITLWAMNVLGGLFTVLAGIAVLRLKEL